MCMQHLAIWICGSWEIITVVFRVPQPSPLNHLPHPQAGCMHCLLAGGGLLSAGGVLLEVRASGGWGGGGGRGGGSHDMASSLLLGLTGRLSPCVILHGVSLMTTETLLPAFVPGVQQGYRLPHSSPSSR